MAIARRKIDDDYVRLKEQFGVAVGIFQGLIERLKKENPGVRIDIDAKVFDILKDHKIAIFKIWLVLRIKCSKFRNKVPKYRT